MAKWRKSSSASDRYEELMARRAMLEDEVHRRINALMEQTSREVPLAGHAVGGSTEGIRIAPDGSLDAMVTLRDAFGVTSTVVLRADLGQGVTEFQPRQPETVLPEVSATDEAKDRLSVVSTLAHEHLPSAVAEDFLAMLRPALRLVHAAEGMPVVAQLGGLPTLPINSWPVWEGHGPLGHVLSFDCGPVSTLLPELGLPEAGRLAFFYFDGRSDDYESTVGSWDPSTRPGFRVLHLHPEQSTRANITDAATPAPPGLAPFPAIPLAAIRTVTWPSYETPAAQAVWDRHGLAGRGRASPPLLSTRCTRRCGNCRAAATTPTRSAAILARNRTRWNSRPSN